MAFHGCGKIDISTTSNRFYKKSFAGGKFKSKFRFSCVVYRCVAINIVGITNISNINCQKVCINLAVRCRTICIKK
jgi:hypothetical protein